MQSIHDNNVYAYCVLSEQRRIVLFTEYGGGTDPEFTDIVFDSVVAHHFECALEGNILFGVEEVEPARIVAEWADLFSRQKRYGWPNVKYHEPAELIAALSQSQTKAFEIGSSHGLTGWVLAGSMTLVARPARMEVGEAFRTLG